MAKNKLGIGAEAMGGVSAASIAAGKKAEAARKAALQKEMARRAKNASDLINGSIDLINQGKAAMLPPDEMAQANQQLKKMVKKPNRLTH